MQVIKLTKRKTQQYLEQGRVEINRKVIDIISGKTVIERQMVRNIRGRPVLLEHYYTKICLNGVPDKVDNFHYKVGDAVVVKNCMQVYDSFTQWVRNFAPDYLRKWKRILASSDFESTGTPQNGDIGIVVAANYYNYIDDDVLYLIQVHDKLYLIGEAGLR